MKTVNIILCGLGGQGILFMTKILAQAALKKQWEVMGAETHGMAQRGGSVISHLRLGTARSSLVSTGTADFVLALDENEAYRNLPFLAPAGGLYVNTAGDSFPAPAVKQYLEQNGNHHHSVPASRIAHDRGAPMSANLALVAFFAAVGKSPFSAEEVRETVIDITPERFKDANLKVFEAAVACGP